MFLIIPSSFNRHFVATLWRLFLNFFFKLWIIPLSRFLFDFFCLSFDVLGWFLTTWWFNIFSEPSHILQILALWCDCKFLFRRFVRNWLFKKYDFFILGFLCFFLSFLFFQSQLLKHWIRFNHIDLIFHNRRYWHIHLFFCFYFLKMILILLLLYLFFVSLSLASFNVEFVNDCVFFCRDWITLSSVLEQFFKFSIKWWQVLSFSPTILLGLFRFLNLLIFFNLVYIIKAQSSYLFRVDAYLCKKLN